MAPPGPALTVKRRGKRVFHSGPQSAVVDLQSLAPMLEEEATMRELLVVFQEGFDEANITVMVNGAVVASDGPQAVRANPLVQAAYLGAQDHG